MSVEAVTARLPSGSPLDNSKFFHIYDELMDMALQNLNVENSRDGLLVAERDFEQLRLTRGYMGPFARQLWARAKCPRRLRQRRTIAYLP
jgi:hypothetical protein